MSYKIRIERTEKKLVKSESYEKVADTGNERDGKSIYAYVPKNEEKEFLTNVLSLEVEEINLEKIIEAIFKK